VVDHTTPQGITPPDLGAGTLDHCPDIDDDLILKTARDDQVGTSIEAFEAILDAMTEMIEAPETHQAHPARKHHDPHRITGLTREGDHYDSHSTNLRWLRPRCRAG
jgi:hypothetical protein